MIKARNKTPTNASIRVMQMRSDMVLGIGPTHISTMRDSANNR